MTICSNGSAPLNKMVTMPIYGKTKQKTKQKKKKTKKKKQQQKNNNNNKKKKKKKKKHLESSSPEPANFKAECWYIALGTQGLPILFK